MVLHSPEAKRMADRVPLMLFMICHDTLENVYGYISAANRMYITGMDAMQMVY